MTQNTENTKDSVYYMPDAPSMAAKRHLKSSRMPLIGDGVSKPGTFRKKQPALASAIPQQ